MPSSYDVFLSHNSADKRFVEALAHKLSEHGVVAFLDQCYFVGGDPVQETLELALLGSRACAVLLGAKLGAWQNEEMRIAIAARTRDRGFRVIPVLLPGAARRKRSRVSLFLQDLHWVDFRHGIDDEEAFLELLAGIRGEARESVKAAARRAFPYTRTLGRGWVLAARRALPRRRILVLGLVLAVVIGLAMAANTRRGKIRLVGCGDEIDHVVGAKVLMSRESWGWRALVSLEPADFERIADTCRKKGEEIRSQIGQGKDGYRRREDAATHFRRQGDSLFAAGRHQEALAAYRTASEVLGPSSVSKHTVEIGFGLGSVRLAMAKMEKGEPGPLLDAAIDHLQKAFWGQSRDSGPQEWARMAYSLGVAQLDKAGLEVDVGRRKKLLEAVLKAMDDALGVWNDEEEQRRADAAAQALNVRGNALHRLGELEVGADDARQRFKEAEEAYSQALVVLTKETFPADWANSTGNRGAVRFELAKGSDGTDRWRHLEDAKQDLENVLAARSPDSREEAETLNQLGLVLRLIGEDQGAPKGIAALEQSITAHKKASQAFQGPFPTRYARAQNNLGLALIAKAELGDEAARADSLSAAIAAFRRALDYYEPGKQGWFDTSYTLAVALGDRRHPGDGAAAEAILAPLREKFPSQRSTAYMMSLLLWQDQLNQPQRALELALEWRRLDPQNPEPEVWIADLYLRLGRFAECLAQSRRLQGESRFGAEELAVLQGFEIAALLALGRHGEVPDRLQQLQATIGREPLSFWTNYDFAGTKQFVRQSAAFGRHRDGTLRLFQALGAPNRTAILHGLSGLEGAFAPSS